MKLFKAEVRFKRRSRGRAGVDVIVHAKTREVAERKLRERYTGGTVEQLLELDSKATKHFVIAYLVD